MTPPITELVQRLRDREAFVMQGPAYLMRAASSAADSLEEQASRIAALDAKCRLYEAALDKADGEIEDLKCELREAIEGGFSKSTGEKKP